jgi:hypothetical protein
VGSGAPPAPSRPVVVRCRVLKSKSAIRNRDTPLKRKRPMRLIENVLAFGSHYRSSALSGRPHERRSSPALPR